MIKTKMLILVMLAGYGASGCVGDEALVYTFANAARDDASNCEVSDKLILPYGTLDINDAQGSLQNYIAYFIMQTTLTANGTEADKTDTPSFPHYGSVDTNKIFLEEAEVSYDFGYAALPPEDRTLDLLPQRFQQPMYTMISEETVAGSGGKLKGTGFATVELFNAGVSSLLLNDANVSNIGPTGRYPVAVHYKVRGRTSGGARVETSDFVYRVNLCIDCKPGAVSTCYPDWRL